MKKHMVTWTPEVCTKGEYEGTVTLRMPTYDERLELYEDVPDLEKDADEKAKHRRNVQLMRAIARKAGQFVEQVAIKRVADSFVFAAYDDVQMDTDLGEVVTEIVTRLAGKYAVGNPQQPS